MAIEKRSPNSPVVDDESPVPSQVPTTGQDDHVSEGTERPPDRGGPRPERGGGERTGERRREQGGDDDEGPLGGQKCRAATPATIDRWLAGARHPGEPAPTVPSHHERQSPMRRVRLAPWLLSTALAAATAAAPTLAIAGPAAGERAPAAEPVNAPTARPQADDDAARYAARERAADPAVAEFQGGAAYVAIGGTTLAVIALVVLLVILL